MTLSTHLLTTLLLWRSRSLLRRELRDVLMKEPDSVLEDLGYSRAAARAEVSRWFWQPMDVRQRAPMLLRKPYAVKTRTLSFRDAA